VSAYAERDRHFMAAGNLRRVVKNYSGGPTDNTDLTQCEQINGLPIEPVTIRCPGTGSDPCAAIQPGPYDADYHGEFDLDTQSSTGIAGGVKHLYVYYTLSPLLDANIVLEFNLFQSDDLAKVGSASFGGCEDGPFLDGSMLQIDEALELASSQGQTMFASTGDTGGSCSIGIPNGVPTGAEGQVEYPASSPFVVGAGACHAVHQHQPRQLGGPVPQPRDPVVRRRRRGQPLHHAWDGDR
jgi:subtilase family serine protease